MEFPWDDKLNPLWRTLDRLYRRSLESKTIFAYFEADIVTLAETVQARFSHCWVFKVDLSKMIAELFEEREQVDHALLALERLARGQGKRRGRPPAWMTTLKLPKRRRGPPGSKTEPEDKPQT